jgi:hypothetical protein
MDYIETSVVDKEPIKCIDDQLKVKPKDIRAEHCQTANEYRLWRFSSNYQTSNGGEEDVYSLMGINDNHVYE